MVMDAFVRYMAAVKNKTNPNKTYVDTIWLTQNGRKWEQKNMIPCDGWSQYIYIYIFASMHVDLLLNSSKL